MTAEHVSTSADAIGRIPIRRALISVYDKTGLKELAVGLNAAGVSIVSTGSTAQVIADAGVPVEKVESVTGFPEILEGRVKTLHPFIHAGILADRRKESHQQQLDEHGIAPFDLVITNLYPFVETVASGAEEDEIIEKIDIGGPAMVRAAAKNHANIAVVVNPAEYSTVVEVAKQGGFDIEARKRLAAAAFAHTAEYDNAVARWTAGKLAHDDSWWPAYGGIALERAGTLRYGENPHQKAALYVDKGAAPGIAQATQLGGKEMSYNNYVDADAALRAAFDHEVPAVAIIKHANPCGIAQASPGAADPLLDAYQKAHASDPVSAYGGVIAVNRPVTLAVAEAIKPVFTEAIVAPSFDNDALALLKEKKNLRLLELPEGYQRDAVEIRQVSGGVLTQVSDRIDAEGDISSAWQLVAGQAADAETLADLEFAWTAVRAVKSNAILLAKDGASVGVGMGQVNRVDSCKLAVERAGADRVQGSVAASDAFFPFADGLQVLLDAGVKAVVQPGGSIRDEEVIAAAKIAGVTMYLTGARHFYH